MTGSSYSRLSEVAVHLPATRLTTPEVEARLAARNPGVRFPPGAIELMSGVRSRQVAAPGLTTAELAAAAARELLDRSGRDIAEIDLLLFAATSMTVVEPAMAHLVAAQLGATCAAFDVRNACNSVVNAIEVADVFVRAGRYRHVLVVCGEWLSPMTEWQVRSVREFVAAGATYTVSDAGAALLVEASEKPGLLGSVFGAHSAAWRSAVVPATLNGRSGYEVGSFRVDGTKLLRAYERADLDVITKQVADLGFTMGDFAAVCVHQPVDGLLPWITERLKLREDQLVPIVADHGNVAAAGLPLQLTKAVESGQVRRGDLVALVGLASGVSFGVVILRW